MNLLYETIDDLSNFGKSPTQVEWVGSEDVWFTWEEFCALADTEYDDGFGWLEVAEDIMIVGDSWWMERHEYDGAERWSLKEPPMKPSKKITPKALTIHQTNDPNTVGWSSLANLNE